MVASLAVCWVVVMAWTTAAYSAARSVVMKAAETVDWLVVWLVVALVVNLGG